MKFNNLPFRNRIVSLYEPVVSMKCDQQYKATKKPYTFSMHTALRICYYLEKANGFKKPSDS
jgi:hypothetical protein